MAEKVLVAGASGLVGAAAVDAFLEHGWEVLAVSRRRPEVFSDRSFQHLSVDLQDEAACKAAFSDIRDVSHIVYTAVYEKPGLIAGWAEQDQMQTNLAMLRHLVEPLSGDAALEHVTIMRGPRRTASTCTRCASRHVRGIPGTSTRTSTGCRRTT